MELFKLSPEQEEKILKKFQITENELNESIEIIKIWKAKQPHLPAVSDEFIRRLLIRNKFRIERTKTKLDNYFTLRGQNRDLVTGFEKFVPSKMFFLCLPLPRVTPNVERVIFLKLIDINPNNSDYLRTMKIVLATIELGMHYDDSVGVRFILDLEGFTFKHFLQWNPILLHRTYNLLEKAHSWRILEFSVMNAPDFIAKVLAMVKLVIPAKIYERIHVFSKPDELLKNFSKECLPNDFGGTCGNLSDLIKQWDKIFENHNDFFLKSSQRFSNEELRPFNSEWNEMYGPEGSFKKITLD